jgi:hypothetical protein
MQVATGANMGMGMAYNTGVMEQILLNRMAEAARVQAAERAKKSKMRDPYTMYELCRAFGWAHVGQVEHLPPLWADLLTSKDPDDHRTLIMAMLKEWSIEAGIKINPGLYLTKDPCKRYCGAKAWERRNGWLIEHDGPGIIQFGGIVQILCGNCGYKAV